MTTTNLDLDRAKRSAALAEPTDLSGWTATEADWEPSYGADYDGADDERG